MKSIAETTTEDLQGMKERTEEAIRIIDRTLPLNRGVYRRAEEDNRRRLVAVRNLIDDELDRRGA